MAFGSSHHNLDSSAAAGLVCLTQSALHAPHVREPTPCSCVSICNGLASGTQLSTCILQRRSKSPAICAGGAKVPSLGRPMLGVPEIKPRRGGVFSHLPAPCIKGSAHGQR